MLQIQLDVQELEQGFWEGQRCLSGESVQLPAELGKVFTKLSILVHSKRLRGDLVTRYKHFKGMKSVGY